MSRYEIQPFYHPTTVVFVDDSRDFLHNLSLQLPDSLAYRLFSSPLEALDELNSASPDSSAIGSCFSMSRDSEGRSLSSHVVDLNLDLIHREVYNEHRFGRISVAVVDYDMPEINGLEFCRKIANPAVRKILLTGKADEKIAVRAFNSGLIDRFILKADSEVIPQLNSAIAELQHEYFGQIEKMLADMLAVGEHDFLRDAEFAELFREICRERKIVEHYLCANPSSILLLDADAEPALLIVRNDEQLLDEHQIAYDLGAPKELLEQLKSGEHIPYFWKSPGGHYSAQYRNNWREHLYPARQFEQKNWYCHALVENPGGFKAKQIYPYRRFLEDLDREGRG